ncbi:uncharacterized protein N7515_000494 [Penicillium bovifimosum]|uniref:Uncharacterized protein n=1 Tax=Penicillium bovifimosum TaxID=126998 RepID=A0A9W9LBH5_9EURO|nr:uncharacterized protein N7515_000494 [Penicillium bovifimosum]KAJ5145930.1 hypothetical protein N7515_000494 [Penicillium bovifimosum]
MSHMHPSPGSGCGRRSKQSAYEFNGSTHSGAYATFLREKDVPSMLGPDSMVSPETRRSDA